MNLVLKEHHENHLNFVVVVFIVSILGPINKVANAVTFCNHALCSRD